MSLGKIYYDPKHAAGYGSVANLGKASKKKRMWSGCQVRTCLPCTDLFVKAFLVIRIL